MLKKIYDELVAIREELHAIRNGMESWKTFRTVCESHDRSMTYPGSWSEGPTTH